MRRLTLAGFAVVALAAPAPAAGAGLYRDGPVGRSLLGGRWLFRLDPGDAGLRKGYARHGSARGWAATTVPDAWNAHDDSDASMRGTIGWYRKDFRLPSSAAGVTWLVRFESVNYRAHVWLNGHDIGRHEGAFLPFELRLRRVLRSGTNRLVVRIDNRRRVGDLPPSGETSLGVPSGGWWNSGGILREVYLRPVRGLDLQQVTVLPSTTRALVRARMHNYARKARRVVVTGRFGAQAFHAAPVVVPAGGERAIATRINVRKPRLWSPASPYLYPVSVRASAARWSLHTGLRSIEVSGGRLYLNGTATSFRGVGYHEDTPERGMAVTNGDRAWLVREAQALGATMMRTHYPPGAYLEELADRTGMLLWSEIPVYQMQPRVLKEAAVRARAVAMLRRDVEVNGSHPSIVTWSIGNELGAQVGPGQGAYIRAAARAAHGLDPTRPVALATNGYAAALCQTRYGPLDVLGLNEYYGWYPGPDGLMFDRFALSDFLDKARACYPRQALVVTEFGAEANRDGPVEEKGTYAFQQAFVDFHLQTFATKPWLSGALYWALNEFRVRPGWEGGNPRPTPPLHQKGLVTSSRQRKPAWENVHRAYAADGLVP